MEQTWKWTAMPLLAILAAAPAARGQYEQAQQARLQRMWREQAVARFGSAARPLVEAHGEAACRALAACSLTMGRRLAGFFNSGKLDSQIPRPRALLLAIGSPGAGDAVAWWAMQHAAELGDLDACDAFLLDPVSYALGVKSLEAGAAEMRGFRLRAANGAGAVQGAAHRDSELAQLVAGLGCLIGFLALAHWLKRRQQQRTEMGA